MNIDKAVRNARKLLKNTTIIKYIFCTMKIDFIGKILSVHFCYSYSLHFFLKYITHLKMLLLVEFKLATFFNCGIYLNILSV